MKAGWNEALAAIVVVMCLVGAGAQADDGDAKIIELEKSFWAAWAQGDVAPFEKYATDDTVNVTPNGITVGKADLIKNIGSGSCEAADYSLGDMTVVHPADNVAIVVYSADQDAVCDGARLAPHVHVTSVFVKRDGEWRSAAYAETPAGM